MRSRGTPSTGRGHIGHPVDNRRRIRTAVGQPSVRQERESALSDHVSGRATRVLARITRTERPESVAQASVMTPVAPRSCSTVGSQQSRGREVEPSPVAGSGQRRNLKRVLIGLGAFALVTLTVLAVADLVSGVAGFMSGENERAGARDSADRIGQVIESGVLDDADGLAFVRSVKCDHGSGDPGLTLGQADAPRAQAILVSQLRAGGWHGQRRPYGDEFVKDFDGWSGVVAVVPPPEGTGGPLAAYVTVGGSLNDDCAVFRERVDKLLRNGSS